MVDLRGRIIVDCCSMFLQLDAFSVFEPTVGWVLTKLDKLVGDWISAPSPNYVDSDHDLLSDPQTYRRFYANFEE